MLSSSVVAHVTSWTSLWSVDFDPTELLLPMDSISTVKFRTDDLQESEIKTGVVHVITSDGRIANPYPADKTYILKTENISVSSKWSSAFNATGNFLGYAEVRLELRDDKDTVLKKSNALSVKVVRSERVIDHIFTYSVAVLVSVIYINFGCALDWSVFKKNIRRPVGPIIGFLTQFLIMPLVSCLFLCEISQYFFFKHYKMPDSYYTH